ncbi:MAG: hypothetical protein EPN33_14910 [Acidobacteria bacterium]|nr:MAG: hypothetical protein EPN33_14910 [Acidobacteriota bacterium]
MKSWWAILLPLAIGVIGLAEFIPRFRTGAFGTQQIFGLVIVGICFGIAWGAASARFKKPSA